MAESSSIAVHGHETAQEQTETQSTSGLSKTNNLIYTTYTKELEPTYLPLIRQLISRDLSEPYSIYVYRYFLYQWPELCLMCLSRPIGEEISSDPSAPPQLIGVIINKLEPHGVHNRMRGYIAMLAVQKEYRGRGIAGKLVRMAVETMRDQNADEIALETEVDNIPSLKLYERLGFLRSKRLHRYYLNGNGAFRLILNFKETLSIDAGTDSATLGEKKKIHFENDNTPQDPAIEPGTRHSSPTATLSIAIVIVGIILYILITL